MLKLKKFKRLHFIDAVRAFAILMMLQGHFIDELLQPVYRENTNFIFSTWLYLRGLTAPTFFTVSGLIFMYLMLKARLKQGDRVRIRKGISRGFVLIIIGYALRMDVLSWIKGKFSPYILEVDVLHCIGLSIIITIGLYLLFRQKNNLLIISLFTISFLCFLMEPLYQNFSFNNVPNIIANYFSNTNGSVFTLLPWFGYFAFGAFIATCFNKFMHLNNFKLIAILFLLGVGYLCSSWSASFFVKLYELTNIELFHQNAYNNYLFSRFGSVLFLLGIFYGLERLLQCTILLKIGQKTLSIYIIHSILLYGSFTGIGLKHYLKHSLNPQLAVVGTLCFTVIVCLISLQINSNIFFYSKIKSLIENIKRKL